MEISRSDQGSCESLIHGRILSTFYPLAYIPNPKPKTRNPKLPRSDQDLADPFHKVCLDGCIVKTSDGPRPNCLEIRTDVMKPSKGDATLGLSTPMQARNWEKAIVKGILWHAVSPKP